MHFNSDQPKHFVFPNNLNILDYEQDYALYFPTTSEHSIQKDVLLYKENYNSYDRFRNSKEAL
ncbi:hypothetical protein lbkm_0194 [Lachnospiraceae bacterium KM106-2]|nr:hypothetical protein lbkm_0194 [Lachnospiraceae bacterium KM106-2]